jgi:hypothetical protein
VFVFGLQYSNNLLFFLEKNCISPASNKTYCHKGI